MNAPSEHQKIKTIFLAAIERPLAEQAAFIAQACHHDEALIHEVESLVAHHREETLLDPQNQIAFANALNELPDVHPQHHTNSTVFKTMFFGNVFKEQWKRVLTFSLVILALGGVGYWTYLNVERSLYDIRASELRSILKTQTLAMEAMIDERKNDAISWATTPEVNTLITQLIQLRFDNMDKHPAFLSDSAPAKKLDALFSFYLRNPASSGVGIIDRTNTVIYSTNRPDHIGQVLNAEGSSYLIDVFTGKTRFLKPYPSSDWMQSMTHSVIPERPMTWIETAVKDAQGNVVAALGFGKFADEKFKDILKAGRIGDSGETVAFDDRGVMLTETRFTQQLKDIGLLENRTDIRASFNIQLRDPGVNLVKNKQPELHNVDARPLTKLAALAIASRNATDPNMHFGKLLEPYRDHRGVDVIGVWRWLPSYNFGVLTQIDVEEAIAPLEYLRIATLLVFCALSVFILYSLFSSFYVLRLRHSMAGHYQQVGQYKLIELIGEGGMGQVYRASHALLKRPTAIKLIKADQVNDLSKARFELEVQVASQLTHPNTIAIYDYGQTDEGTFYYAMEYLSGITLSQLISKESPLPVNRTLFILKQICCSLREAHEKGLIHRDIKPLNIMLCHRGGEHDVVKVLDFGLVKRIDNTQTQELTQIAQFAGTPLYMAPERLSDPKNVDIRTDIYAVGAVAYKMLTGTDANNGVTDMEIIYNVMNKEAAHIPHIPKELEAIILASLQKDPNDRPSSVSEFLAVIQALEVQYPWYQSNAEEWWNAHQNAFQTY